MSDNTSTVVKFGDHIVDMASLPSESVVAMFRRGLAHYLGNEQASKLTGWKDDFAKEHGREPTDAEYSDRKAQYQADAVKLLAEGKVGGGVRGPRGSALETVMRKIAEGQIRAMLKQANLSFPAGDKKLKFANGTELTGAELIARRIASHGDAIKAAAEKQIRETERQATKAANDAGGLMAALGLE